VRCGAVVQPGARDVLGVFTEVLRPGEQIVMTIVTQRWRNIVMALLGIVFFGYLTLDSYNDYYAFESVEQACGQPARYGCLKYYYAASWLVSLGSVMTVASVLALMLSSVGLRPFYVLTTERILARMRMINQRIDSIELRGAVVKRKWTGVQVNEGRWKMVLMYVGGDTADRVFECASDLIGKQAS
jgi:hypothetical protein